jgi:6-phosphogluconolactonase (cycloisomerase 2 family)
MNRRILTTLILLLLAIGPNLAGAEGTTGVVYAMTNAETGNQVLAYPRLADGTLGPPEVHDTGGLGFVNGVPVDPLRSQGSLVLSPDHRWLLAVNAGSDQVSVFRMRTQGLELTDVASSGGVLPVSVTIHRDLVYVLNAGGTVGDVDTIAGFTLSPEGRLSPLAGSTRILSQASTDPAQVGFTPDGSALVVTEKATDRIDVFPVDDNGLPGAAPAVTLSEGAVPFGFVFNHRGRLLVSEAAGSVSSYVVTPDGTLSVVSSAVPNGQIATCWIAGNRGRFAFTANTGSSTLSSYGVGSDGNLTLLQAVAAALPGALPIDSATPRNGRNLYTVNAGTGTVGTFAVGPDGTLLHLGDAPGLPVNDGAQGIAVH